MCPHLYGPLANNSVSDINNILSKVAISQLKLFINE